LQETIQHLESVFPQVSNRHPSCVQFRIEVGSINIKGRDHEKWVAVSDFVWPDAMVESRPETIFDNFETSRAPGREMEKSGRPWSR
jgi:hypothetical protein